MTLLKDWHVTKRTNSPYQAPETGITALSGNVFGHHRFKDGDSITTSEVIAKDGDMVVTMSGSYYALGQPDSEYAKQFPDAKDRLLKSLPDVGMPV